MGRIAATYLMPDFTGCAIDRGRYRLLENVGSGAYGKVYRAIDTSYRSSKKQLLAIKCLNKPRRGSHAYLCQQREFEHHKLVSGHPNIVTFHRYFTYGLYVYVALDFCKGGDLFYAITEKHLFQGNERLIKSVFVQLIDAVTHCHRLGVFHRDIKPENVLCSDDGGYIRLTDFGLSIMSPYSKDFGCGSSYYMSPECIGRQLHLRQYATSPNDIWALGVILTNLTTDRNPWRYAVMQDDCFAAYMNDNDFLKKVLPISDGVSDILKDIFIVNPARRLTLAKLRSKILALDAFWTPGSDLAIETEIPCNSDSAKVGPSDTNGESLQTSSVSPFKAGRAELQSNIIICDIEADDAPIQVHGQPLVSTAGSLTVPFFDSSASSGPESDGPITPTTHAVDVGHPVDIPDITSAVLGDSVGLQKPSAVNKLQDVVANGNFKRFGDIFRAAVQRIKILSKPIKAT